MSAARPWAASSRGDEDEWIPVGVPLWNHSSSWLVSGRFGCQEMPKAQTFVSSTGTQAWPPSAASCGKAGSTVKHGMPRSRPIACEAGRFTGRSLLRRETMQIDTVAEEPALGHVGVARDELRRAV